jgi:hypothetical protein
MGKLLRSLLILGAVLGLISSAACNPKPAGGNDRPPIVVSDGSVLFKAVAKDRGMGHNSNRGEWKPDSGRWYHDHDQNPAKILRVSVLHGTGTGCTDPEKDFDVREFELTYKKASDSSLVKFRVFIDAPNVNAAGRLTVDSPAVPDTQLKFWLHVGDPNDKLDSVKFPDATVCGLAGPYAELHVYQIINP